MTKQQIYLKAAKRVATGSYEFSCNAISYYSYKARDPYAKAMSPTGNGYLTINHIERAAGNDSCTTVARDFRVLLLCMMAAACDDLETEHA